MGKEGRAATDGIILKLTEAIFAQIERKEVVIDLLPWKRCLMYVRTGARDGVPQIRFSDERAAYMDYTAALFEGRTVFFYNKERHPDGIHWHSLKDLTEYTIGTVIEYTAAKILQSEIEKGVALKLDLATEEMTSWKKILAGRLDLVVANEVVGYDIIVKNGWGDKIEAVEKPLYSKEYFMSFSKKSSARNLIPEINAIIAELKRNGKMQSILTGNRQVIQ